MCVCGCVVCVGMCVYVDVWCVCGVCVCGVCVCGVCLVCVCVQFHFFPWHNSPSVGQGRLIIEASRSHSDTPQSVGLLWTRDRPAAGTST